MEWMSGSNFGTVRANKDIEPFLHFTTKVTPCLDLDSDIVVIVYDVTQDGANNNAFSWYE